MQIQRISPAYVAAALSGGCPGQTTCTHCQQLRPPLETLADHISILILTYQKDRALLSGKSGQ